MKYLIFFSVLPIFSGCNYYPEIVAEKIIESKSNTPYVDFAKVLALSGYKNVQIRQGCFLDGYPKKITWVEYRDEGEKWIFDIKAPFGWFCYARVDIQDTHGRYYITKLAQDVRKEAKK